MLELHSRLGALLGPDVHVIYPHVLRFVGNCADSEVLTEMDREKREKIKGLVNVTQKVVVQNVCRRREVITVLSSSYGRRFKATSDLKLMI